MPTPATALTYSYSAPYSGGGEVVIHNPSASAVTVESVQFVSNAVISGDPWGTLWPGGTTITSKANPGDITYTYILNLPVNGVTIATNSSAELSYSWTTAGGPLAVAMNPVSVDVQLANQSQFSPLTIAGQCEGASCNDPAPGKRIVGYYTDWDMYARKYPATAIPVRSLNQINYAFLVYGTDGSIKLYDTNSDPQQLPVIAQLRQQYPYLNACLAFGGWTLSADFSALAANPVAVKTFTNNVVDALQQTQFNCAVVDWEYPASSDATNYANFLQALYVALTPLGYLLNIAAPAGVDKIRAIQNGDPTAWSRIASLPELQADLMTYDYFGAWNPITESLAPMLLSPESPFANSQYCVEDTINIYLQLGFKPQQLAIGIPIYGRAVNVAEIGSSDGMWQNITGTPPGQYDGSGIFDYKCIQLDECNDAVSLPADLQFVDPLTNPYGNYSQTPWAYSNNERIFISYDNVNSTVLKAMYVVANMLGGVMFWSLSGDAPVASNHSLVAAAQETLSKQRSILVDEYKPLTKPDQKQDVSPVKMPVIKNIPAPAGDSSSKMLSKLQAGEVSTKSKPPISQGYFDRMLGWAKRNASEIAQASPHYFPTAKLPDGTKKPVYALDNPVQPQATAAVNPAAAGIVAPPTLPTLGF